MLFVLATKIYQFKAKDSEIKDCKLCLGNISKDFTINAFKKKTGLKGIILCTIMYDKLHLIFFLRWAWFVTKIFEYFNNLIACDCKFDLVWINFCCCHALMFNICD